MYKNLAILTIFAFVLAGCVASKTPVYDYTTGKPKVSISKDQNITTADSTASTQTQEQAVEELPKVDMQVVGSAIEALHSKCMIGEKVACNDLGATYEQTGDYENALKFYAMACDNGIEQGCANLGMMYEKGLGVAKNPAVALEIYTTSCNNGGAISCYNLATAYRKGDIVAQDYQMAFSAYNIACQMQDVPSCANLGSMYELGLGVKKDEMKAYNIYKVACFRGFNRACPHMERLAKKLNIKQ